MKTQFLSNNCIEVISNVKRISINFDTKSILVFSQDKTQIEFFPTEEEFKTSLTMFMKDNLVSHETIEEITKQP